MRVPIRLTTYEIASITNLTEQFSLGENFITAFAESLEGITELFQLVGAGVSEFRAGRVVMIGLLNHAHHNLAGALKALEDGNAIVWANCVRSLVEVFGACVLIAEEPGKVANHLEAFSAGKLYSAAERGQPGLKGDIKKLHGIVHPGPGSIYSALEPEDIGERTTRVEFGLRPVTKENGLEAMIVLANLALWIEERIRLLAEDGRVLAIGKRIMVVT